MAIVMVLILGIGLFWSFGQTDEDEKQAKSPTIVWVASSISKEIPLEVLTKEKNSSVENEKPTVTIYGSVVALVEEQVSLRGEAKDKDGEIVSYLWKEGDKILGSKDKLSVVLPIGEHTLTLRVKDNLGAVAKESITLDVYGKYTQKEFYRHEGCGCQSTTYTYYNEEGNISKTITQSDDNGVDIEEYTYDEEGHLISTRNKIYDEKGNISGDTTMVYDEFEHITERFGKELSYGPEGKERLVSFHTKSKYDKEHKFIVEESSSYNGKLNTIERRKYDKDGNNIKGVTERYKNGVLEGVSELTSIYNSKGNLLRETSEYIGDDGQNVVNYVSENIYNSDDKLLKTFTDNDGDGEIDSYYTYEYDSRGHLIKQFNDYGGENNTYTVYNEYDENGNQISRITQRGIDDGGRSVFYTYDEEGRQISSKRDDNGDGDVDNIDHTFYAQDGEIIREETDSDADGTVDSYTTYTDSGLVKESKYLDNLTTYIYDEETGKMLSEIGYSNDIEVKRVDYIYDDNGVLIKKVDDNGTVFYRLDTQ